MNAELNKYGEDITVDLNNCVHLGKLIGFWGVKGWLKVFSHTRPRKNIGQYQRWLLVKESQKKAKHSRQRSSSTEDSKDIIECFAVNMKNCKEQGQNIVAKIEGIDYRDQAEALLGFEIFIEKTQLKPTAPGEYYWTDLIGCQVKNTEGVELGKVSSILETGANDVLVVRQEQQLETEEDIRVVEHLIPYSEDILLSVEVANQQIIVDWGEDYLFQEHSPNAREKAKQDRKLSKQERSDKIRLQKQQQKEQKKIQQGENNKADDHNLKSGEPN